MTFVRVSGSNEDNNESDDPVAPATIEQPPPAENPIMMLDQEQINRLENVLRSEEAKDFLGEVLANPNPNLGDFLNPSSMDVVGPPPPLIPNSDILQTEADNKNKRRSQRQIDRELKEEAERIRRENQALLKKEKEAMSGGGLPSGEEQEKPSSTPTTTAPSGR